MIEHGKPRCLQIIQLVHQRCSGLHVDPLDLQFCLRKTGHHRRDLVLDRQLYVGGCQLGVCHRPHMRVDMRHVDAHRQGQFDLGAHLGDRRSRVHMPVHLLVGAPHIPCLVHQPAPGIGRRDRAPAIPLPLAGQGDVDADVGLRVPPAPGRHLGHPRAGHHDRAAGHDAIGLGLPERDVGGVAHAYVVGVDDHHACIGRHAQFTQDRVCHTSSFGILLFCHATALCPLKEQSASNQTACLRGRLGT